MLDENGVEILEDRPIDEIIVNGYEVFGKYVNESRHIPYLKDGLKPVYRRLIQTAYEEKDRLIKTATMTGLCMAKYHPHGDSINDVVPQLVNMNIFSKKGVFGKRILNGANLPAAAPRYTECKLNTALRNQFDKLLPYVNRTPSYAYGYNELEYIPTPIPMSLVFSAMGIGFGIGTRIPPFTVKSLYEAYINNDPMKLELNYGYSFTDPVTGQMDDCNKQGIQDLWNIGRGTLNLHIPCEWVTIDGETGALISCDPILFKPLLGDANTPDTILYWEACGYLNITDLTDMRPKLFISRTKRTRVITDDDIWNAVLDACHKKRGFYINVFDGNVAGMISMHDWIDYTYKNYTALYQKYINSNVDKIDFDIVVWKNFRRVAELILDDANYDYATIVSTVNKENAKKGGNGTTITEDHVSVIGKKSINTLRNADADSMVASLEDRKTEFQNLDIESEIVTYVDAWADIAQK